MTIAQQPPRSGTGQSEKRWYRFAHASKAVRHTEASAQEKRLSCRFGGDSSVREWDFDARAAEVDHRDQRVG